MHLFFNGVSSGGYIALLGDDKSILQSQNFNAAGNESTLLIPLIDDFLADNEVGYSEIENIICVTGPGSFTGIRTISLIINTLAFIYPHISLTSLSFFDLYDCYPIVKSSSKRDLFVKLNESDIIQVMTNSDFESRCSFDMIYGDTDTARFTQNLIISSQIDYQKVLREVVIKKQKRIAPEYVKKPNIS